MAIAELMHDHHQHCDAAFAEAEDALRQGRWTAGRAALAAFSRDMESHFAAEEDILFPAFEEATGMVEGPTKVMSYEHDQMRDLLSQMMSAADAADADEFAGAAETLLVLMQQHNAKEEHILYPMCDSALDAETLAPRLQQRLAGSDALA
ncbi:MAG: hemerythrin domain-containing protein [Gammaproteobacteria bacterium]|nr:hemerythrin domain-containing protein [Gammaproteobacteria bacterium]